MSQPVFKSGPTTLTQEGDVYILSLGKGMNRFNPDFIQHIHNCLDFVEHKTTGAAALVTKSDDVKFFSNGLDLEWIAANNKDTSVIFGMIRSFQKLLARIVLFPVPTVAAINGHAIAGGAMFALAHDVRLMRSEKFMWWLSEVDIGLPFTPGMSALITGKLSHPSVFRDAMFFGKKFSPQEAKDGKVVDEIVPNEQIVAAAVKLAQALSAKAMNRTVFRAIKQGCFQDLAKTLNDGVVPEGAGAIAKL